MVSERDSDRTWMETDIERAAATGHTSFAQVYVDAFGWNGTLDLIALQASRVWEVNLTHRPFAGNPELKELVRAARAAIGDVAGAAYAIGFAELDRAQDAERAAAEAVAAAVTTE